MGIIDFIGNYRLPFERLYCAVKSKNEEYRKQSSEREMRKTLLIPKLDLILKMRISD